MQRPLNGADQFSDSLTFLAIAMSHTGRVNALRSTWLADWHVAQVAGPAVEALELAVLAAAVMTSVFCVFGFACLLRMAQK